MIRLRELTKRHGAKTAVEDLSLEIREGQVTGFLGPNGAGKSTTMRMIVGLDQPTSGQALIDGTRYAQLRHPLREVGAVLEAKAMHPGRSARHHLIAMARSNGIPASRVDEVLEVAGLIRVADDRVGTFSLGMGQRLGVAGALLGDPKVLMLDEPVNGLDPDGVRWVRQLMRSLADGGRTVFVSSHLMSEMQIAADHLVIIGKGQLLADAPMAELVAASSRAMVKVRSPEPASLENLRRELLAKSFGVEQPDSDGLMVSGATVEQVGDIAHRQGVRLHELRRADTSLELAYMELTGDSVEYGQSALTNGVGGPEPKSKGKV